VLVIVVVAVGYTTNDVIYRWNMARKVDIAVDMKLSQFDLIATPSANQTDALQSGRTGLVLFTICKYSCNMTEYIARRHLKRVNFISEMDISVTEVHIT
jgi:hypothetical protein